MDWFKNLGAKTEPAKRASTEARYYVKSDNRVVAVRRNSGKPGYHYKKRTSDGTTRNITVTGNTYKSKEDAVKKAARQKSHGKK